MVGVLPDMLRPRLRVVFCGTAAGTASARAGAYYAGPGNAFWATLHSTGLTPVRLLPAEFERLPGFGIDLTDICKVLHGSDREVGTGEFDVAGLEARIAEVEPVNLAFNGQERRLRRVWPQRRLRASTGANRRRGGLGSAVDVRCGTEVLARRALVGAGTRRACAGS